MIVGSAKPPLKELAHFGVKGMHWGVHNDHETSGYRLQAAGPTVDSTLHKSTQVAGKQVASLIGRRYNYHVSAIKSLDPELEASNPGLMGYVLNTPGQSGGVIYAHNLDIRKHLKDAEDLGWFAKDCGNTRAFFTHESAHAIFHAEQKVQTGLFGSKKVGGNHKARDTALKAAVKQAKRDGIPVHQFAAKVSGYASSAGMREEVEAEMFAQYHWSPNPPKFVKVWGQTLHQELGIDGTPFSEGPVKNG